MSSVNFRPQAASKSRSVQPSTADVLRLHRLVRFVPLSDSCTIDPVFLDSDGSLAFGKTSLAVAWLEQLQKSGKSVTTSIYAPVPAASGFLIASSRVLIAGAIILGPVVGAYWPANHL